MIRRWELKGRSAVEPSALPKSSSQDSDRIQDSTRLAPATTSEWVGIIRPHLIAAVDHIIEVGRKLNTAKAELPHGQFGPLLDELGLSRQMANRFMRVANNEVLSNRSPVVGLPAAVSVLDVLTQLDDDDLDAAITAGEITASTTRQQASKLVAHYGNPNHRWHAPGPIREQVDRTVAGIIEQFPDIPFERNLLVEIVTVQQATEHLFRHNEFTPSPSWWNRAESFESTLIAGIAEYLIWERLVGITDEFGVKFLADGPLDLGDMLDTEGLMKWDECPDDFTIEDRQDAALGRWFVWNTDLTQPDVRRQLVGGVR